MDTGLFVAGSEMTIQEAFDRTFDDLLQKKITPQFSQNPSRFQAKKKLLKFGKQPFSRASVIASVLGDKSDSAHLENNSSKCSINPVRQNCGGTRTDKSIITKSENETQNTADIIVNENGKENKCNECVNDEVDNVNSKTELRNNADIQQPFGHTPDSKCATNIHEPNLEISIEVKDLMSIGCELNDHASGDESDARSDCSGIASRISPKHNRKTRKRKSDALTPVISHSVSKKVKLNDSEKSQDEDSKSIAKTKKPRKLCKTKSAVKSSMYLRGKLRICSCKTSGECSNCRHHVQKKKDQKTAINPVSTAEKRAKNAVSKSKIYRKNYGIKGKSVLSTKEKHKKSVETEKVKKKPKQYQRTKKSIGKNNENYPKLELFGINDKNPLNSQGEKPSRKNKKNYPKFQDKKQLGKNNKNRPKAKGKNSEVNGSSSYRKSTCLEKRPKSTPDKSHFNDGDQHETTIFSDRDLPSCEIEGKKFKQPEDILDDLEVLDNRELVPLSKLFQDSTNSKLWTTNKSDKFGGFGSLFSSLSGVTQAWSSIVDEG